MNKTICIVDDDESILDVLDIMLTEGKYSVVRAENGEELLTQLRQNDCSLILLDVWMPGISGKELINRVKSELKTKCPPIILLSALNELDSITQEYGAEGCLKKPFDINELMQMVKQHIS